MIRRVLWLLLALLVLGYSGLCAWLYANQRQLVYFPQATLADPASTNFALARDGAVLRGWVANAGRKPAIVYFGGNGEAIQVNRAWFAQWLPGHTVYLVAYRGYGASSGTPSQPVLLADALALFDRVQTLHPDVPVAVVGRSLGSGVASYVASQRPVPRLALVTPFDSLVHAAQRHYPWLPVRWLLRERYPSVEFLRGYRGKVLVVRGGRDAVVPPAHTDTLLAALPRDTRVAEQPDAGHNDLDPVAYGRALASFFE